MEDEFGQFGTGLTTPATASEVVTPDDATNLAYATRGLYVGQGGDIRVTMLSGDVVTLRNIQPGIIYPIRVVQVLATGTTATDVVGLR